jgi:hypothetical protein
MNILGQQLQGLALQGLGQSQFLNHAINTECRRYLLRNVFIVSLDYGDQQVPKFVTETREEAEAAICFLCGASDSSTYVITEVQVRRGFTAEGE